MKAAAGRALLLLLVTLLLSRVLSSFGLYLATEIYIRAIFAMSLGLLMGYAGLTSLGHAAFFGLGAYTVALLGDHMTNSYALVAAAVVVTAVVGFVSGALFTQASQFYFLMITLAFGQLLYALIWQLKPLTGGADGRSVRAVLDLGWGPLGDTLSLYYVTAVALVVVYFGLTLFLASPVGVAIKGTMENELRMRVLGYDTRLYKLIAYTLAAAVGGFAGALYAFYNGFVDPELVSWLTSGEGVVMVIVGGLGSLLGPVVGSALFVTLQSYIGTFTERWMLVLGVIFVVFVLVGRGGLVDLAATAWKGIIRSRRDGAISKAAVGPQQSA